MIFELLSWIIVYKYYLNHSNKKEIKLKAAGHENKGLKHSVGEPMENSADVILVPSRLAGKVESIDCHVVTGHTYVSTTYILMHTHT